MSPDATLLHADRAAREAALDVSRSFIVQAPAGSGKTELLIQRYLRLLASVEEPEEVLAITFTRKAAAEMRLRVLDALERARRGVLPEQAHQRVTAEAAIAVLEIDAQRSWGLLAHPGRMRITTIDSLNASLSRMQPLTQASASATARIAEDNILLALYDEAALATLDWIGHGDERAQAIEEVLAHVDNNTGRYTGYLSRMLRTRDQWLPFVRSGIATAAQAAALRQTLERSLARFVTVRLDSLRAAARPLTESEFFDCARYAAASLLTAGCSDSPICRLEHLDALPHEPDSMDAAEVSASLDTWRGIAELLLTKQGAVRKRLDKTIGFPAGKSAAKASMTALLDRLTDEKVFVTALHDVRTLPPLIYSDDQFSVLLALFRTLPVAVSEFRRLCLARGVTDHIEVAISASQALGSAESPGDIALLLDYQVRHILVDEMQDTSKAQYRMLEALTGGWQPGDGRTLFCVGDPMQSIYRFRNAEVAQFLLARERGLGSIELESLVLRQNFRSGERLVNWYNDVFPRVLPAHYDPASGAVAYETAVAAEQLRNRGKHHVYPLFGSSVAAEADLGLSIVERLIASNPADSVAILVRSRTQLPTLLRRLRAARIRFQAVDIDRLSDLPEIIDVLALTRALTHAGDRLAWLAVLRAPWVGLDWTDLHSLVFDAGRAPVPDLLADEDRLTRLSARGRASVSRFLDRLSPFLVTDRSRLLARRVERAWFALGGAAVLDDANAVSNVYHFFDSLAQLEVAGAVPDVAALAEHLDTERVSTSTEARVQVMTMHKAKGLEFDHVLLFGLGRHTSGGRRAVLSWFDLPDEHGAEAKIISPVGREDELEGDPIHAFIDSVEKGKDEYENGRLLYVACTRAKRSLHLLGNVVVRKDGEDFSLPHSGSLLRLLWPAVREDFARAFDERPPPPADDEATFQPPRLRRLDPEWTLPDVAPLPGPHGPRARAGADQRVDYEWVGLEARLAGTIVHRWLQLLADGKLEIEAAAVANTRATNLRWLARLGARDEGREAICERVERSLERMLEDPRGRWLLDQPGEAELALQGTVDGHVESIVIDRVCIDADGTHWIVDYKTSSHEGGNLAGFLNAEADRYREQLSRYQRLYLNYSGQAPRCALYFPLLSEFIEVDV